MKIPLKQKVSIVGIGFISSLLILLIIYVLFARVIVDFIMNNIAETLILGVIVFGLLLLSFIISITIGFLITDEIRRDTVIMASMMSLLTLFTIILIVSYTSMAILYPGIYSKTRGPEAILIFPQVILYFSIYVLDHPFYLFIISSFVYFIIFTLYLESYYQRKPYIRKKYEPTYRRY